MRLFHRVKSHWGLLVVLIIYITVAVTHSIVAPLTVGNDEWAHFLYTRFITEHGRLPLTWTERDEAGYKSDAPPLYHLIVSAMTSSLEPTRLLRPIDSPQRQLADNVVDAYAIVHTGVELPPFRGEVLLWHAGRAVSILFGVVMIGLTYLTSLQLFPGRRRALTAAALLGFLPAFVFHSSVLSYESLSALFAALFLLAGISVIKHPGRRRWWLALGALAGLSITTKYSAVLLPFEILVVAWLAHKGVRTNRQKTGKFEAGTMLPELHKQRPSSSSYLVTGIIVASLALVAATSWWFGFVLWNFNTVDSDGPVVGILQPLLVGDASDTTSVNVAAFFFGQNTLTVGQRPPLERDYPQLFRMLSDSFWAAPVAGKSVGSPWLSLLFSLLALFGLASLWRVWQHGDTAERTWLVLLLLHSILIVPLLVVRLTFSFDPREVVQGRHLLLPAASAIPILLVWGWDQWGHKLSQIIVAGLLLWTVLGQLGWTAVVYPSPLPVWAEESLPEGVAARLEPLDHEFAEGSIRLMGVKWLERPEQAVLEVTLLWKAFTRVGEDYLIELRLLDEAGEPVSFSLGHPVQGRYPTRAWEPGDVVEDIHRLPLVDPLAGDYQLQLRLLDHVGQPLPAEPGLLGTISLTAPERPPDPCAVWVQGRSDHGGIFPQPYRLRSTFTVIGPDTPVLQPWPAQSDQPEQRPFVSAGKFHVFMVQPDWTDTYQLFVDSMACGEVVVDLPARDFTVPEIPNPLAVTFNDEVELLGYDLPTRRINPGGRLPLTLYWRARDYVGADYRIFDNLLDVGQQRWGGYDRQARDGYSTLLWAPGEVITDAFGVPVEPDAPDGIYTLDIGLYREAEVGAVSLPLSVDSQPVDQHSVRLGPIKVGGPPPEVTTGNPSPRFPVNRAFGNEITLLGYDLTDDYDRPIKNQKSKTQNLKLTLYWRADSPPKTDYTTFLHWRNEANENVAQQDSPPANGRYPTSLWDSGEIIVDEIVLPLTDVPAGEYTAVVGLYDFATGVRLPVGDDPAGELRLESVMVP